MNNYNEVDEVIDELEKEVNNIKKLSELISDIFKLKGDISKQAKEIEESLNEINILSNRINLYNEETNNLIKENLKSIEVVVSNEISRTQDKTLKGFTYIKNNLSELKLSLNEYEVKFKKELNSLSNKINLYNKNNKSVIENNFKEFKIISESQKNKNKLIFIILFIIASLNVCILFLLIK